MIKKELIFDFRNLSMDKEKAFFEAGIKLGAALHQFVGMPLNTRNVDLIEKAIESCILLQPYVTSVKVNINREKLLQRISYYGYTTLSEDMLKIEVCVEVGKYKVLATLEWDEDKKYPLMSAELVNKT